MCRTEILAQSIMPAPCLCAVAFAKSNEFAGAETRKGGMDLAGYLH